MPRNNTPIAVQDGPSAPRITIRDLLCQFWVDIYGKEVQSATTYSYTWVADQAGHLFIGIIASVAFTAVASYVLSELGLDESWASLCGLGLAVCVVSIWEYSAFRSSVAAASGTFPVDRDLLRKNAVTAAVYMTLGAVAGFGFQQTALLGFVIFIPVTLLAIACAPWWLRQKIIWQKAALPYLFRLADLPPAVRIDGAEHLQAFIDEGVPPAKQPPLQVIVGGPIGSGRTAIAAGIGTEFAFKSAAVRYIGLDRLREFATQSPGSIFADDRGPTNINYWPWREAQVVIVDDIGPFMGMREQNEETNHKQFTKLLGELEAVAPVFAKCHSVWVVGDLDPVSTSVTGAVLDKFASAIGKFCGAKGEVLVVELSEPQTQPPGTRALPKMEFSARVAKIRKVNI